MTPELEQQALELILEEIRERCWAMTEQFLAVHTLEGDDGGPKAVHVESSETHFEAWFKPKDENYYLIFGAYLKNGKLALSVCIAEAGSRVYLNITSDTLSGQEITMQVGLEPTRVSVKGAERRHSSGKRMGGVYKQHRWTFDPLENVISPFNEKFEQLLLLLEPVADRIRALKPECSVTVQTAYQGFSSQMWGITMSASTLERLAALGADLDVDLYAGGPELPD